LDNKGFGTQNAASGQKSVFLYIAPSVANRKWPGLGGWRLAARLITVLCLETVCPRGLFKIDTEKLICQVRNNVLM
jgi:hypothetical protein